MKKFLSFLIVFFISISFVIISSGLIAGGFYLLYNKFLPYFLISCGLIILIGIIYNNIKMFLLNKHKIKETVKAQKIKSEQTIQVSCAFCGEINNVSIELNRKNSFQCLHCNRNNNIIFQFSAVATTTQILKNSMLEEINDEE